MFVAWLHLGIRPSEFNKLSWWEQKLAVEGLSAQRPWVSRTAMTEKPKDLLQGAFQPEAMTADEEDDFLAATGFRVRTVEVQTEK